MEVLKRPATSGDERIVFKPFMAFRSCSSSSANSKEQQCWEILEINGLKKKCALREIMNKKMLNKNNK